MGRIAVFGGANMDILGFPVEEMRLRDSNVGRIRLRPGGVGRNIAERLARMGRDCLLLTVFGSDPLSDMLRASCDAAGVDISHALRAEGAACAYLCLHDGAGDMLAAVNDMALARALSPGYAQSVLPVIDGAALCVLDANPPEETLCYLAERTKTPLLLDPVSCAKAGRARSILPYLAAIKPNLAEARFLTGCSDARDCARALVRMGVKRAFVSLGADGLCYADAETCGILPAVRLSRAPQTGAGDALCAGLAAALAEGADTVQCARYGLRQAAGFLELGREQE